MAEIKEENQKETSIKERLRSYSSEKVKQASNIGLNSQDTQFPVIEETIGNKKELANLTKMSEYETLHTLLKELKTSIGEIQMDITDLKSSKSKVDDIKTETDSMKIELEDIAVIARSD